MKKIVILGAKESGAGAAYLAKQLGYNVFVSDFGKIDDDYKFLLNRKEIPFEEGVHTEENILDADIVIKSPGVPSTVPIMQKVIEKGIQVISEIEFASRYTAGKIIAITGSNGKTTATSLVYHILRTAGLNVTLGGNIGISFAKNIADKKNTHYHVLEVSSFQLDDITSFSPDVAILLNITPDHLDRYDNKFENYVDAKCKITGFQTPNDAFIFNSEDKNIIKWLTANSTDAELFPTVLDKDDDTITVEDIDFSIADVNIKGSHNLFNVSCAIKAALLVGVSDKIIQKAINSFQGIAHRMESVAVIDDVEYINDSKATNIDAVSKALKSIDKGIVWIVGGKDKGNDYSEIAKIVDRKVSAIICLGKDNSKLLKEFEGRFDRVADCHDMKTAVTKAKAWALKGETVLLSPACASFDLFTSYEDRGSQFKSAVCSIKNPKK